MCGIHVKDPAAAFEFYTKTLGFAELLAMPEANLFIVKSPEDAGRAGGAGLLLGPSDNPIGLAYREGLYDAGIPVIVFGVPDVRAEYERLTAAGVRFLGEPVADPSGTMATFDDTCGNYVRIHQD